MHLIVRHLPLARWCGSSHKNLPTDNLKGCRKTVRQKGRAELPPAKFMRPWSIACLDVKSKALMPSIDITVARGSISVYPCKACAMHSQRLLVAVAYWNGAVAACTLSIICWDIVRATNLLTMSPATILRTPPLCFWSGVRRPNLMASRMGTGTCALHNFSHAWKNAHAVIPEGPPAAHLFADRMFRRSIH